MADLDHFKALNDTYGHEAGDKALRHFSTIVRANLRPQDVPCRFGGEEFVFVLPGYDAETAAAAMERLRVALGESFNGTGPIYSASFGVADSADGTDLESLLRVAHPPDAAEGVGLPVAGERREPGPTWGQHAEPRTDVRPAPLTKRQRGCAGGAAGQRAPRPRREGRRRPPTPRWGRRPSPNPRSPRSPLP